MRTRAVRANEGLLWPLVRLRAIGVSVLLGAALTMTACGGGSASTTGPAATATLSGPSPTPTPGSPLTLQAAWGAIPILSLPTDLGNNQAFVFEQAATPDGQWLIGAIQPRDFGQGTTQPSYVALYNIHTRQIKRIHALLTPQSQVLGASVDDHWISWSEAEDQPSFFDWTMFLYNRDTGQTSELASAPKVNGQAVQGANTPPVVSQGHVIWSQPIAPVQPGDGASLKNLVVKIEDLSTGKVTTLATSAGQSTLSWPWAAWGQITAGGGGYVQFKNLQTGQEAQLSQHPATLALHGASVAYDDNYTAYLINDITKDANDPQQIASSRDIEWVTLNDRLVTWQQDSTQPIVWDRVFNRPVILPEQNTIDQSQSWVAGNLLVWWQAPGQQQSGLTGVPILQIVDTSTLPATPVSPS